MANAVQANILGGTVEDPKALNQVYNVAVGDRTTLNDLSRLISATCRPLILDCRHFASNMAPLAQAMCATHWPTSARRQVCSAISPPTGWKKDWPRSSTGTWKQCPRSHKSKPDRLIARNAARAAFTYWLSPIFRIFVGINGPVCHDEI